LGVFVIRRGFNKVRRTKKKGWWKQILWSETAPTVRIFAEAATEGLRVLLILILLLLTYFV